MRKQRYNPEWYVERPEQLDIQLDESLTDLAIDHNEALDQHANEWFELYYRSRNLAKRPPFDSELCQLKGILVYPYSLPIDRRPACALIGVYDVEEDARLVEGMVIRPLATRYDHQPVHLYIDTHGGNFEYLSCGVADDDSHRVFELSTDFSIHVAEVMKDYYQRFCSVDGSYSL